MEGESEVPPSAAEPVMEAGCAATATMAPNVNHDAATPVTMVPVTKQMSDAAQFSYSAVCALTLRLLYSDDCHRSFNEEFLQKLFVFLAQPDQVCVTIKALLEGHGSDDPDPFINVLLSEPILQESVLPLITDLIGLVISKGTYDARARVIAKHLAWLFRVDWKQVVDFEGSVSEHLKTNNYEVSEEEAREKDKRARTSKFKRFALIGLATVGGGTLIGLTGGLAAPLVAAGAGAIIGGTGAAALATTTGVAVIGSLFGVAGAGLTGYKMKRRVGAVEEFVFEPLIPGTPLQSQSQGRQLHITIAVNGWLNSYMKDYKEPWLALNESREQYSLRWESKYLLELGKAFDYIFSLAVGVATQEALKYTILSGLMTAIAWPASLVSAAAVIDNPWSVCLQRSREVGKQLAEVLLAREQGCRPVTLVGYSLGARVIFCCLEELANRKGCEGIIDDVILLGAPVSATTSYWEPLTKVVSGKLINGYCRADWMLKFLYRSSSMQVYIAGLMPVKMENRCMHNIDLSDVVKGHLDYMKKLDCVLRVVGMRTKDCDHFSTSSMTARSSKEISDEQEVQEITNKFCQNKIQDDYQSTEEHDSLDLLTSSDFDLTSEHSFGDYTDTFGEMPSSYFHQPYHKQREVFGSKLPSSPHPLVHLTSSTQYSSSTDDDGRGLCSALPKSFSGLDSASDSGNWEPPGTGESTGPSTPSEGHGKILNLHSNEKDDRNFIKSKVLESQYSSDT